MRTITWANTSHRLNHEVLRFFVRNRLARCVHLRKVVSQLVGDLQLSLRRDSDGLEAADAHRFAVLNAASQKRFENGLLVRREIVGISDHDKGAVCSSALFPFCHGKPPRKRHPPI